MGRVEDVLAAHTLFAEDVDGLIACSCSKFEFVYWDRVDHRAHVAAALAEAGIGDLAEERERIASAIEDYETTVILEGLLYMRIAHAARIARTAP